MFRWIFLQEVNELIILKLSLRKFLSYYRDLCAILIFLFFLLKKLVKTAVFFSARRSEISPRIWLSPANSQEFATSPQETGTFSRKMRLIDRYVLSMTTKDCGSCNFGARTSVDSIFQYIQ